MRIRTTTWREKKRQLPDGLGNQPAPKLRRVNAIDEVEVDIDAQDPATLWRPPNMPDPESEPVSGEVVNVAVGEVAELEEKLKKLTETVSSSLEAAKATEEKTAAANAKLEELNAGLQAAATDAAVNKASQSERRLAELEKRLSEHASLVASAEKAASEAKLKEVEAKVVSLEAELGNAKLVADSLEKEKEKRLAQILYVRPQALLHMTPHVRIATQETICIVVERSETIRNVKEKIQEQVEFVLIRTS